MLDKLPHLIDPISFADRQRVLKGQIPLTKLSRLADLLLDNIGHLEVDLSFSKDGRLSVVRGRLRGELIVECRTCLQAVTLPLDVKVNLAVVKTIEQAERLSGEYEPLMVEDEKILLHEMIEDEVLLILPDFPRHTQECQPYKHSTHTLKSAPNNYQHSKSDNPFSVLSQLKNIGD